MGSLVFRLARAGLVTALVVGLAGWAMGRARFGRSDDTALLQVEAELRQRFDASADTLGTLAARVAAERDAIRAAPRDPAEARRLFDAVDAALSADGVAGAGLTVYDTAGAPLAWAGRVSELPPERTNGPAALFVAPGGLGPRLVRVEPVVDPDRPKAPRLATIVAEQVLGHERGAPLADTFTVTTSLVPVQLRVRYGDRSAALSGPYSFVIPSRGGGLLVDAEVLPADLAAARARWARNTWAALLSVIAVTLLVCAGPLLDLRRRPRRTRTFVASTAGLFAALAFARAILWIALAPPTGPRSATSPIELLLDGLALTVAVWLLLDSIERRRLARPRMLPPGIAAALWSLGAFAAAGAIDAGLIVVYERFLASVVAGTSLDLLRFSLHPLNTSRLAIAFGLVLLHASVVWGAVIVVRLGDTLRRTPRATGLRVTKAAAWALGAAAVVGAVARLGAAPPLVATLAALGAVSVCALAAARQHGWGRRASQAARLGAVFVALFVPALALYPSLLAYATAAKEQLVATEFGPQAVSQRENLQPRLESVAKQIDAMPGLPGFVTAPPSEATSTTAALAIWSKTDLATYRLTSAIELYAAGGALVSRFANLPEYTTAPFRASGCQWDLIDEVSPFGSSERHVLRASRGICERGREVGSIVVRVMLDFRALPFISSENPYLESLRPDREPPAETAPGRDVEFVVYGWSRAPIFASGTSVWALPDDVFQRMVESRAPFWASLTREDEAFRVYFLNDRGGIYALGYPVITWFGHLVNIAELMTLTLVLYVAMVVAATLFNALTSATPASGRALLREIRSSFYRKLFLAFVLAAVVPVVILAVATQRYFAAQSQAGIADAAARTATVAERLVEDYAALQQRGAASFQALDDQIMVLVGRAIDQDVNLFDRSRLQATSERDLFVSGLLPTRTPGEVYRRIVLDRLPTFVGVEAVGDFQYLLAAAPVRAGGRDGIVTVPLTLRQQELEQQIDELDRRVLFAAVLFSVLGAALGYWMAERIADPVNRLTRATRRIARGDLDARIAATSSDELRRLVEDFNQMAADLQRQRVELERSQRLRVWADMARQVAHDIKNPLTPIQLSAEHARRVNIDRGRPLSPVLDECVNAILGQVRLLRQISSEFSSFASSPTPRPEPTRLEDVLEEVVEPYRLGLTGRIAIDVDAPADLPEAFIDRTLFGRALTNVIENALHAMPGQGALRIAARRASAGEGGAVIVTVADTGVGMDPESVARIFEPYFSTRASGTGLGLTIAKRNIELNGGTIQVESERGAGTTVTMTLPMATND